MTASISKSSRAFYREWGCGSAQSVDLLRELLGDSLCLDNVHYDYEEFLCEQKSRESVVPGSPRQLPKIPGEFSSQQRYSACFSRMLRAEAAADYRKQLRDMVFEGPWPSQGPPPGREEKGKASKGSTPDDEVDPLKMDPSSSKRQGSKPPTLKGVQALSCKPFVDAAKDPRGKPGDVIIRVSVSAENLKKYGKAGKGSSKGGGGKKGKTAAEAELEDVQKCRDFDPQTFVLLRGAKRDLLGVVLGSNFRAARSAAFSTNKGTNKGGGKAGAPKGSSSGGKQSKDAVVSSSAATTSTTTAPSEEKNSSPVEHSSTSTGVGKKGKGKTTGKTVTGAPSGGGASTAETSSVGSFELVLLTRLPEKAYTSPLKNKKHPLYLEPKKNWHFYQDGWMPRKVAGWLSGDEYFAEKEGQELIALGTGGSCAASKNGEDDSDEEVSSGAVAQAAASDALAAALGASAAATTKAKKKNDPEDRKSAIDMLDVVAVPNASALMYARPFRSAQELNSTPPTAKEQRKVQALLYTLRVGVVENEGTGGNDQEVILGGINGYFRMEETADIEKEMAEVEEWIQALRAESKKEEESLAANRKEQQVAFRAAEEALKKADGAVKKVMDDGRTVSWTIAEMAGQRQVTAPGPRKGKKFIDLIRDPDTQDYLTGLEHRSRSASGIVDPSLKALLDYHLKASAKLPWEEDDLPEGENKKGDRQKFKGLIERLNAVKGERNAAMAEKEAATKARKLLENTKKATNAAVAAVKRKLCCDLLPLKNKLLHLSKRMENAQQNTARAEELLALIDRERLNPSQAAALKTGFQKGVSVVQGPPGTGKTKMISSLARGLNQTSLLYPEFPILDNFSSFPHRVILTASSNKAVFNMLEKILHDLHRNAAAALALGSFSKSVSLNSLDADGEREQIFGTPAPDDRVLLWGVEEHVPAHLVRYFCHDRANQVLKRRDVTREEVQRLCREAPKSTKRLQEFLKRGDFGWREFDKFRSGGSQEGREDYRGTGDSGFVAGQQGSFLYSRGGPQLM